MCLLVDSFYLSTLCDALTLVAGWGDGGCFWKGGAGRVRSREIASVHHPSAAVVLLFPPSFFFFFFFFFFPRRRSQWKSWQRSKPTRRTIQTSSSSFTTAPTRTRFASSLPPAAISRSTSQRLAIRLWACGCPQRTGVCDADDLGCGRIVVGSSCGPGLLFVITRP